MVEKVTIKEKEILTSGLAKLVSVTYLIPNQIFCPKCGNFAEYKVNYKYYRCSNFGCKFGLTAEDYIKLEKEKIKEQ